MPGVNSREPRDVNFYGLPNVAPAKYLIISRPPLPLPPILDGLMNQLQPLVEHFQKLTSSKPPPINAVLVNRYCNGQDSMGMHADNYYGMGSVPFIVSLSFGGARTFNLQSRNGQFSIACELKSGSVLFMYGRKLQVEWKHGVFKCNSSLEERWNLSFRNHIVLT